ncbi:sugar ABC transporter substrate-binding protein [Lederbergia sp. NSJ-179]|uniref:ABC transporter substrate-binding protein n=1 Tax=Lederbergia sp. NSJ-179 TaxID=2931402 RepID=UPI001FD049E8|nr:sugar ABC transporter substrate-binding protein [Lederbergia sp. NSJ-179]MCJ7841287.1 sugar ABC transporter substrate-binding protein [Lederbergia sp. NSJ-179]
MEKLKIFKWSILLCAVILIISGCSSKGQSENGSAGSKKIKLTMAAWGNPAEIKVYQRGLDEYEKTHKNVSIKLIPVPGDNYEQKLLTQLSGGQAQDIFYVGSETMPKLVETGKIVELTDFLESDDSYVKPDEFADGLWGAARQNGEIYGVSVDNNPYLMYYNKKVLEEAGIEKSPQEHFEEGTWNWDTFEEMTGKMKDAGQRGFVAENNSGHLFSWVWSNGGQLFDEDGNYILEENEKAQETFEYLAKLVKGGNITYSGSLPKGQGADAMFMSNQVGFVAAGRWLTPMFSENKSLEFDYIPWPTNTGNKMEPAAIAIAYMSVSKDSKHIDEAMKFLSYYTSAEGQKARLADNGNAVPSVNGVDELITDDAVPEHAEYLIDARNIGKVEDKQVMIPGMENEIKDLMDLMYLGKQDANKTIEAVSKKAKEMIEEHRGK